MAADPAGDKDEAKEVASAVPFGPGFFLGQLRAFARERCPDPGEGLPNVELHLAVLPHHPRHDPSGPWHGRACSASRPATGARRATDRGNAVRHHRRGRFRAMGARVLGPVVSRPAIGRSSLDVRMTSSPETPGAMSRAATPSHARRLACGRFVLGRAHVEGPRPACGCTARERRRHREHDDGDGSCCVRRHAFLRSALLTGCRPRGPLEQGRLLRVDLA